ncbi:MAG TPA: MFS transporter [Gaiellaceae bacterium]|nr:MFS transporter [Gaiellaceae bacterium]
MSSLGARLRDSAAAFASVARNANLRRLELAWAASVVGHYAFLITVSVYAYEQGGPKAVGLVFLLRLIPAALVSPFAGLLADRYPRQRVLIATEVTRLVLVGSCAAGVYADAPAAVVYALAIAATIAVTPYRSAHAALTPSLTRSPSELTAANAVASGVESLAVFVGPALSGLVLAITETGAAFLVTIALLVVSTFFLSLMRLERPDRPRSEIEPATLLSEAFAGFRAIRGEPTLRVMLVLLTAQTAVAGLVQVFIVVTAIELLDLGPGGVGFLNSSMGVGALLGAVAALALTGVHRLGLPFMIGNLMWGLPLVVAGLWPEAAVAILVFGLIGLGNSIADVAGLTMIQRSVADDVLARVFGVIQMLWFAAIGIGAAIAPLLIVWLDVETALIATGTAMMAIVALFWPAVARIDAAATPPRDEELRILTGIPIFSPLPGGSLEHLASRLVPLRLDPGTVIVREGDAGDRFYIVAEGEIDVSQDGEPLSALAAGDYFGEISLLRDVPRTATVVARTHVVLYALDRDDFLAAVTGHPQSADAAEAVVASRLAGPVTVRRAPAA